MSILNENVLKSFHPLITVLAAVKQATRVLFSKTDPTTMPGCSDDQSQSVQTTVAPLEVVKHLALTLSGGKRQTFLAISATNLALPTGSFS